jgi:leucyl-tRNA synthetase
MGVPAHDTRDGVLAEVQGLPVVNVISKTVEHSSGGSDADADGVMVNSGEFDGLRPLDAKIAIGKELKVC